MCDTHTWGNPAYAQVIASQKAAAAMKAKADATASTAPTLSKAQGVRSIHLKATLYIDVDNIVYQHIGDLYIPTTLEAVMKLHNEEASKPPVQHVEVKQAVAKHEKEGLLDDDDEEDEEDEEDEGEDGEWDDDADAGGWDEEHGDEDDEDEYGEEGEDDEDEYDEDDEEGDGHGGSHK